MGVFFPQAYANATDEQRLVYGQGLNGWGYARNDKSSAAMTLSCWFLITDNSHWGNWTGETMMTVWDPASYMNIRALDVATGLRSINEWSMYAFPTGGAVERIFVKNYYTPNTGFASVPPTNLWMNCIFSFGGGEGFGKASMCPRIDWMPSDQTPPPTLFDANRGGDSSLNGYRVTVGAKEATTGDSSWVGNMIVAEVAVWEGFLSERSQLRINQGENPLNIDEGTLRFYAPYKQDYRDVIHGWEPSTIYGNPMLSHHPEFISEPRTY